MAYAKKRMLIYFVNKNYHRRCLSANNLMAVIYSNPITIEFACGHCR